MTKTEKTIQKLNKNNVSVPEALATTTARLYEQTGLLQANDEGLLFLNAFGEKNTIKKNIISFIEKERNTVVVTSLNGHGWTFTNVEYPDAIVEVIEQFISQNRSDFEILLNKFNPVPQEGLKTTVYDEVYECPECGESVSFKNYHYIEVSKDNKELKELLLKENEEFFEGVCPKCGNKIKLTYPLQYVDTEKQLQIVLLPDRHLWIDDLLKHVSDFHVREGYTTRLTTNFSYLNETIKLFDEGLDDRLMQLFKLSCWLDFIHSDPKFENAVSVYQWYISSRNGQKTLLFVYRLNDETETTTWDAPDSYYEEIKEHYEKSLSQTKPFEIVSYNWAVREMLRTGGDF